MHWTGHPAYLTCLYAHGFDLGVLEYVTVSGPGGRRRLNILSANDALAIAEPAGPHLPDGDYSIEGASVNGIRPLGQLRISSSSKTVTVTDAPQLKRPFTLAIFANPGLLSTDGAVRPDPIASDAAKYNQALGEVIASLMFSREDLLREAARSGRLRVQFLTLSSPASVEALVEEVMPNIARPRQPEIAAYLAARSLDCDVALVLQGSLDFTRASARFTVDSFADGVVQFDYDGRKFKHGRATEWPGTATVSFFSFDISHTPLHEFGHAASEVKNGQVTDLYHDTLNGAPLVVNKKSRRPIPTNFAAYNRRRFNSDKSRNHLGYDTGWSSYHPELRHTDEPNLMDDYWQAHSDPRQCTFDRLTYAWLADRIKAKAR